MYKLSSLSLYKKLSIIFCLEHDVPVVRYRVYDPTIAATFSRGHLQLRNSVAAARRLVYTTRRRVRSIIVPLSIRKATKSESIVRTDKFAEHVTRGAKLQVLRRAAIYDIVSRSITRRAA